VNTFLGMKIDLATKKPHFRNRFAGYSGPAIKPMALRIVFDIFSRVNIPVIGLGGISSVEDVIEFMLAGASAVSIGTMSLVDPMASVDFAGALEQYLDNEGFKDVKDITGLAHR